MQIRDGSWIYRSLPCILAAWVGVRIKVATRSWVTTWGYFPRFGSLWMRAYKFVDDAGRLVMFWFFLVLHLATPRCLLRLFLPRSMNGGRGMFPQLRATSTNAGKFSYPNGGCFAEATTVVCRRTFGGGWRRCVDVLAIHVLGVADESSALLAASVALLKAIKLEFYTTLETNITENGRQCWSVACAWVTAGRSGEENVLAWSFSIRPMLIAEMRYGFEEFGIV